MLHDLGWLKQVKLEDVSGTVINPATEEKLEELKTLLQNIDENTDGLELKADTVNLNTDELEEKLDAILQALGEESGSDLISKLQLIINKINVDLSTRASEATLVQVRDYLDTVEIKLQSIRDQLDVALSSITSENTSQSILNALGQESGTDILNQLKNIASSLDVDLSTIATEATLIQVRDYIDTLETKLQSLIDKNQAKETGGNLDTIKTNTDKLDVNLSTRASETTLEEVRDTIGQESGSTILSKLKDLWDKLHNLFVTGLAKVKIWDGINQVSVTDDNKLKTLTHGRGRCSLLNSTMQTLEPNQSFIGEWEEILDYSIINILVFTDKDSAIDGLVIEWSCDGETVENEDKFTIYANCGKTFSFGAITTYCRIKYTNGSNTQNIFRLQTLFKPFNQKPSSHRINEAIVGEDDAELVKAVLTGQNGGDFINVKVDDFGRIQVVLTPALNNQTLQLLYDRPHSAINAGEWQEVLDYTVPMGYNLNILAFEAKSQFAGEGARAIYKEIMGTFNCSTNTFTDGTAMDLPRFATRMYLYVITGIGSALNDTFTVTYTNSKGVTGRTAIVTVTKSSLAGTRVEVPLQSGDRGLIDITNITHSATDQAGEVQIGGYMELLSLTLTSSNTQYQSASIALGGIIVFEGETIYLQYLSDTKTTYTRRLNLMATLVPTG